MIVPAPGGPAARQALAGEQRHPAWSLDGRLIAFVSAPTMAEPPEVFTMRPDGGEPVRRTSSVDWGSALNPSWARRR